MLYGLLDGWFKADVGDAAIRSLVGFVFVFLGIAFLVLLFMGLGKIMSVVTTKKSAKTRSAMEAKMIPAAKKAPEEGIPPEVVAAITAAIAMYYEQEGGHCDFIVKRIKRV